MIVSYEEFNKLCIQLGFDKDWAEQLKRNQTEGVGHFDSIPIDRLKDPVPVYVLEDDGVCSMWVDRKNLDRKYIKRDGGTEEPFIVLPLSTFIKYHGH